MKKPTERLGWILRRLEKTSARSCELHADLENLISKMIAEGLAEEGFCEADLEDFCGTDDPQATAAAEPTDKVLRKFFRRGRKIIPKVSRLDGEIDYLIASLAIAAADAFAHLRSGDPSRHDLYDAIGIFGPEDG